MKKIALSMMLSLPLILSACSSTPAFNDSTDANSATIDNTTAGFVEWLGGDAHAIVREIDGVRSPMGKQSFKLSAGEHEIGVATESDVGRADAYLKYKFEAGKHYRVSGDMTGISAKIRLHEITGENQQKVVKEERMEIKKKSVAAILVF